MSKISVFLKSKFFILGVVFIAIIMIITNPARFTMEYVFNNFVAQNQEYSNFLILSYGTENGYLIIVDRGKFSEPKISVKYISMFNNYFCFMSTDNGETSHLKIISK